MTGATRSLLELLPLLVPEAGAASVEERAASARVIEHALSGRPAAVQRQLALFLTLIRYPLPFLRHGAPFHRLSPERQRAFLAWLESHPVALLRSGFWGVRTLAFMGHYGRPEIGPTLHYVASRDGNRELRP